MSDHIKTKNSDLFIGISEKEQESVSGGGSSLPFDGMFYMFYDRTDVYTRGISDVNISQDNFSGNSRNETEYQFSRTTFVLFSLLGDGIQFNNLINSGGFLSRILRFF